MFACTPAAGGRAGWLPATLLTPFFSMALAACDNGDPAPATMIDGTPAIWEIASADGTLEGWLFGTIHALPDGTRWRSEAVQQAVENADLLVVEIAALEDSDVIARTFLTLSHTPGQPPLTARVPAAQHEELAELVERSRYDARDFAAIESWGAALILAQSSASTLDTANGVDKALVREFRPSRPIREVEGVRAQLSVFDTLPEAEQRDLLSLTVADAARPESVRRKTVKHWLEGDVEALLDPGVETLLDDPELREVLVEGRNRNWMPTLTAMLEQQPKPLIAVGAGHMGGPEGLPVLLRKSGYTVTRMQ